MSLRNRPRLSDRLRGKSGEELLNEIKKEFESNKNAWFDSDSPRFSSLRREGFPFDEDVFNHKGDAGIRSHLEDLAKKHPEFAGDLRCPPWGGSTERNWEKAFTVPISVEKSGVDERGEAACASSSQNCPSTFDKYASGESADGLGHQHGLRNTIDIAEQIQKANQQKVENEPKRSSSAPPDASLASKTEPKRFTSRIEITPVNPFEHTSSNMSSAEGGHGSNAGNAVKPSTSDDVTLPAATGTDCSQPPSTAGARQMPIINDAASDHAAPQMSQAFASTVPFHDVPLAGASATASAAEKTTNLGYQSPQTSRKQPQVHHIPIFVEGRTDPVVPKNIDAPLEHKTYVPDQAPLKRKLDGSGTDGITTSQKGAPSKQNQMPCQERKVPVELSEASTSANASVADSQVSSKPPTLSPQQSQETTSASVPPPPPPPPATKPDPLQRVKDVQQEVDELTNRVEQYCGSSRSDKEYLFLDEMLTRNLIKLDTIEVEGNEQLRTARRDVIKSIQKSIAQLESKVPGSENQSNEEPNEEVRQNCDSDAAAPESASKMDVDQNNAAEVDENSEKTN